MHRMTCRNGLVWQGRRARFVFVAVICLGLMVTSARAGTNNFLVSPDSPTNPASAMWTLEDIYKVLDTRTTNVTMRTVVFTEPIGGPTNGTMQTLNDIMTLVTNRAPVQKTGQVTSYLAGDDGTTRIGVAWPTQRFTAVATSGDATNQIRDNLTGLIWARNANLPGGTMDWTNAVKYCATNVNLSSYGGTNDWRLPNWQELRSLIDASKSNPALPTGYASVFAGVQSVRYWSSTTYAVSTDLAWVVDLNDGAVVAKTKVTAYYVWPVRGGE